MVGTHKSRARKTPLGAINDNVGNIAHNTPPRKPYYKVPGLKLKNIVNKDKAYLPEFVMPAEGTKENEMVKHKICQREKQIGLGKQTPGYRNYISNVPRVLRDPVNPDHVVTPRANWDISKRMFDGYIRQWRRTLHIWDAVGPEAPEDDREQDKDLSLSLSLDDSSTDPNTTMNDSDLSIISDMPPLVPMPEEDEEHMDVLMALTAWA